MRTSTVVPTELIGCKIVIVQLIERRNGKRRVASDRISESDDAFYGFRIARQEPLEGHTIGQAASQSNGRVLLRAHRSAKTCTKEKDEGLFHVEGMGEKNPNIPKDARVSSEVLVIISPT
jgi:hypothetical protein